MLLSRDTLTLTRDGDVFRITLTDTANDNTFSHTALDHWHEALDIVAAAPGNAALVIGSNSPKTFSTGINLGWVVTQPRAEVERFLHRFDEFFLRVATLNLPTLAEINGNCYAGGAILAAACDFRLMRADRGRFCYTEVKIKLPFTPVMMEVVRLLPNAQAMFELSVTADAWGGELCAARGWWTRRYRLRTCRCWPRSVPCNWRPRIVPPIPPSSAASATGSTRWPWSAASANRPGWACSPTAIPSGRCKPPLPPSQAPLRRGFVISGIRRNLPASRIPPPIIPSMEQIFQPDPVYLIWYERLR